MKVKRVVVMLSIVLCTFGAVSAPTLWEAYPG